MTILTDNPIKSLKDDRQNRSGLVHQLSESLINLPSSECIVYGLYGPWGSGKSSFLNFLEEDLQSKEQSVMRFDPWFFSSNEKLIMSFFLSLCAKVSPLLADSTQISEFTKKIILYANMLSPIEINTTTHPPEAQGIKKKTQIMVNASVGFPFASFGGQISVEKFDNNPFYLKERIRSLLATLSQRVYIFIDNIDRLDGDEILMMFKLVRLCADFPMLTFVLSFDREYVTRVISEKLLMDEDYLHKIVQVDVVLPLYDLSSIDSFFFSALEEIANQLGIGKKVLISERFVNLYYSNVRGIFIKDFRSLKRYLNAISLSLPMVFSEVNYCDFLIVELLRVFLPELYSSLPSIEHYLTAFDGISDHEVKLKPRKTAFEKLKNKIEQFEDNGHGIAVATVGLLSEMFPIFGEYLYNPTNPRKIIRGDNLDSYNQNKRICSPNLFWLYFSYTVKPGELSSDERNELLVKIHEKGQDTPSGDLRIMYGAKKIGKLFQVLYYLQLILDSFSDKEKGNLIMEISSESDILEDTTRIQLLDREFYQAVSLVIECIRLLTKEQRDINIRHVINNSTSIRFTIQILYFLRETMPEIWKDDFQLELANKILELIRSDENAILSLSPNSLLATLGFLRRVSRELLYDFDIREYLAVAFRKQPDKVPYFLSLFVSLTLDEKPVEFDLKDVELFVDCQTLLDILDHHQINGPLGIIELFALNGFRDAMSRKAS